MTRHCILVIDDSEVLLARIRRALETEGYEVIATSQAVGIARHIPNCDLAIIDYHMPGIDGAAVIESLRAASATVSGVPGKNKCLFYLYTSDPAAASTHAKLGFDGMLTNKGDDEALVRQLRAIFRIQAMRAMRKPSRVG